MRGHATRARGACFELARLPLLVLLEAKVADCRCGRQRATQDDDFLAECKSAFIDMLSSRALAHPPASGAAPHLAQPSTLIRHVGEVLSAYDAAHFGHPELLKIEGAMVEALDVLATLDSESLFVRAAEGAAQEGSLLEGTMSAHWKNLMVRTQGVLDIWKGLRTNDRVAM